jgi:hydroxymethylpyrimidine/phosphomethylpyrimidine kinase
MGDFGHRVDAMKTGMLSSPSIIQAVSQKIPVENRVVVDPVMVAKGGASPLPGSQETLKKS